MAQRSIVSYAGFNKEGLELFDEILIISPDSLAYDPVKVTYVKVFEFGIRI